MCQFSLGIRWGFLQVGTHAQAKAEGTSVCGFLLCVHMHGSLCVHLTIAIFSLLFSVLLAKSHLFLAFLTISFYLPPLFICLFTYILFILINFFLKCGPEVFTAEIWSRFHLGGPSVIGLSLPPSFF